MGFKAGAVAKGDRGFCDILFSRIVRSREMCQRCGAPGTDTAHIIGRRYSATRCIEDNAWCLCRSCHQTTAEWPIEFVQLMRRTIGDARYFELSSIASHGLDVSSARFWATEKVRLKARCKALGLDTRRRIPT